MIFNIGYDFETDLTDVTFKNWLTHFQKFLVKSIKKMNKLNIGDEIDIDLYNECVNTLIMICQLYKLDISKINLQIMRFDT